MSIHKPISAIGLWVRHFEIGEDWRRHGYHHQTVKYILLVATQIDQQRTGGSWIIHHTLTYNKSTSSDAEAGYWQIDSTGNTTTDGSSAARVSGRADCPSDTGNAPDPRHDLICPSFLGIVTTGESSWKANHPFVRSSLHSWVASCRKSS